MSMFVIKKQKNTIFLFFYIQINIIELCFLYSKTYNSRLNFRKNDTVIMLICSINNNEEKVAYPTLTIYYLC